MAEFACGKTTPPGDCSEPRDGIYTLRLNHTSQGGGIRRGRSERSSVCLVALVGLVLFAVVATSASACSNSTRNQRALTQPAPLASPAVVRPPQPPWVVGQPLHEPAVLRSHDGALHVTLTIERSRVMIGGAPVLATTYNGDFNGPTLRLHLGDTLYVNLVNKGGLTTGQATNLHFHGFHGSPDGNHDNIFLSVAPGKTFQYEFTLGKGNFPGTYWYHTHEDGFVAEDQVVNGLSGLIIIEGQPELLPPALRNIKEVDVGLKTVQVTNGEIPTDENLITATADTPPPPPALPEAPNVRLVDGQLQPKIFIRPGEVQLWHIANIGADVLYKLQLDGGRFLVLAADANAFDHPVYMDSLLMGGGQRYDVLVVGPEHDTKLRTVAFRPNTDVVAPDQVEASVIVAGAPMKTPPMPTEGILPFHSLANAQIAAHRTIVFGSDLNNGPAIPRFTLNGDVFMPGRVDVVAKLGTVEEWTLINKTNGMHPFHMHVNAFQVMSVDGKPVDSHSRVDTFVLPASPVVGPPSTMVVRIPFEDFPGTTVFHCHILGHEDLGMMETIKIVE